jgi:hypothetical protein
MFWRRKEKESLDLDRVGDELITASQATDEDVEVAISSPNLYARIRGSIDQQTKAHSTANSWAVTLGAARLAIPVLALLSVVIAVPALLTEKLPVSQTPNETDLIYEDPVGIGACAISTAEECAVSNNDVLAAIFVEETEEVTK